MNHIILNGKIIRGDQPALMADNRAYRYGDGLFETMKVVEGQIILESYHFDRLFSSLGLLKYQCPSLFTIDTIRREILQLSAKNGGEQLARIRLTVFRGNGGLFENLDDLQYSIEAWPIDKATQRVNENGLVIDTYPGSRKNCDAFSSIKSASHLCYAMAARHAREHRLNECLLLNIHERLADAGIANLFIVRSGELFTPPLSEGGINGVMRRHLIASIAVREEPITVEDILAAEEVFLTNVISGIRWVQRFRDKTYKNTLALKIYREHVQTI